MIMLKGSQRIMAKPKGKTDRKKISGTTRSTAGPGFAFEDQVAAWLLLKMLMGEALPGMENSSGTQLQTQTSSLGWLQSVSGKDCVSGIGS